MKTFVSLYPYWSIIILLWLVGICFVVYAMKTAVWVDENDEIIDNEEMKRNRFYH